jgi:hypothetical protein
MNSGTKSILIASLALSCGLASAQPSPRGRRPPDPQSPLAYATQSDIANAIQRAYDGLDRWAALVSASKNSTTDGVSLNQIMAEAKNAYQEALSRYQSNDSMGVRELAAEATDLSRSRGSGNE